MRRALRAGASLSAVLAVSMAASLPAGATAHATQRAPGWQARVTVSGDTSFSDVSCATLRVCTAVGGGATERASIFRTTDGGRAWARQLAPASTTSLDAVSCPSTTFCLAYGNGPYEPVFVVTRNGGASWTSLLGASAQMGALYGLECVTTRVCYELLQGGLGISTDGGAAWSQLWWSNSFTALSLSCPAAATCFVAGIDGSAFIVRKSIDFGKSVRTVRSLPAPSLANTAAISCPRPADCVAVWSSGARSRMYSTADGGMTWRPRAVPAGGDHVDVVSCTTSGYCAVAATSSTHRGVRVASTSSASGPWRITTAPTATTTWYDGDITCPRAGRCYLAGLGTATNSIDQGNTAGPWWRRDVVRGGPGPLTVVACPSATLCVAAGSGVADVSTDGATSWSAASTPPPSSVSLSGIACPTTSSCLAVGGVEGSDGPSGAAVYRTTDAGADWHKVAVAPGDATLSAVACATATTCIATSSDDTAKVLRSTDAGMTWSAVALPASAYLESVSCGSATDCLAVGYGDDDSGVLSTTNAGSTWAMEPTSSVPGYGFVSVTCSSASTCVAAGDATITPARGEPGAGVYETTNGATSWTQLATPGTSPAAIACAGSVCQEISTTPPWYGPPVSTLQTSSDGGTDWTVATVPDQCALSDLAVTPGGRWVVVGGNALNGALILTSG